MNAMKTLRPGFQRSKRIVSAVFLTAVAGILTSTVHAGVVSAPPAWIHFELDAISLYGTGLNQESSNPQGAVKTLRQAREDSTKAITNGGGANPAVLHNDWLIGQALMLAQADAVKTPENQNHNAAPDQANQKNQKSGGKNPARPASNHTQAAGKRL